MDTKQLGARVPVPLWEQLRKVSYDTKESMNSIVTRALKNLLSRKGKG